MGIALDNITNDFSVEVNLVGRDVDHDRITALIGLQPTETVKAGEPRRTSKDGALHTESFWAYEVSSEDDVEQCRDHQLVCVLDALEPRKEELRDAGVERIYFYVTLSSFIGMMNLHFKPDTMARIGALGGDLYITCFDCFNPKHAFWTAASVDGEAVEG